MEQEQQDTTQEQHDVPQERQVTNDQTDTQGKDQHPEQQSSHTMVIVAVLAIVVVVLALMYMWGANIQRKQLEAEAPRETPPSIPQDDAQTEALKQVHSTDEIDTIVGDLENTELETIDVDFAELEAELEAALGE
jgi:hypothetical protein